MSVAPLLLAVTALLVLAGACTPVDAGPTPPATYHEGRCVGSEGVTVVIDLAAFDGSVIVRCAVGDQASGIDVLDASAVAVDSGGSPGTVCQLNGHPVQGQPYCWTTGGYWSYWRAPSAGAPWTYSDWGPGPGSGPSLSGGAVEGWRFAPFSAGAAQPPRVGTSGPTAP